VHPDAPACDLAALPTTVPEIASFDRHRSADGVLPLMIGYPEDLSRRPRRVAIGNFDGVHVGHAATIAGCDTVLTFDPHPRALFSRGRAPKLLTSLHAKAELLARLGVRELVVLRFDDAVARQQPEDFVEQTLLERLGAVHVSVGENFRYGAAAAGDARSLRACGAFTTAVADLVRIDGEVVCSTAIRAAVEAGEVERASRLLGRPHELSCRLMGRDGRAPAAGQRLSRIEFGPWQACPPAGLYQCGMRSAGSAGRRLLRTVEVLPPRRALDGEPRWPQAWVHGLPDPAWTDRLAVTLLRRGRMPAVELARARGGAN
jgi:riboflavin kinase/FMN adenylyltransferase